MKYFIKIVLLIGLFTIPQLVHPAPADGPSGKSRTSIVNCNQGGASVQSAIDQAQYGQDTTIFIVGFCDESVSIVKSGITLSGNKDGNDLIGGGLTEVKVKGAQRVRIEYLEVTGAGYGVLVVEGAVVDIANNNIHHNVSDGVSAFHHVFVRVEFNSITSNGLLEPGDGAGIEGGIGATIRSRGNYIANNGWAAVAIGKTGYYRTARSPAEPYVNDVILQKGCSEGDPHDCGDSETIAVYCFGNVLCDFRNANVTGEIYISGMSNFAVRDSTINGTVRIIGMSNFESNNSTINGYVNGVGGSRLALRTTVVGSGFIYCDPTAFAEIWYLQCNSSIPPPPI